jgi:hypothetical protein
VVIVGGGPAGLFSALGVLAVRPASVLILDSGPDIDERRSATWPFDTGAPASDDYIRGIGGAGLFSDGKLCMSLDVGGRLEEALDASERGRLLALIEATFTALVGDLRAESADEKRAVRCKKIASDAGLQFKYYPVLHIGTDHCARVIRDLRNCLQDQGAAISAHTRVLNLAIEASGEKRLTFLHRGTVGSLLADNVVLAMGKVGAAEQANFCRRLDIQISSRPLYLGLRLETDAEAMAPLFSLSKDPKYSMRLGDGSKIKTHCASANGQVLDLHYDGLPLAGAHNFRDRQTGRSGFAVLWDGFRATGGTYDAARDVMRRVGDVTRGRLLVQSWQDYVAGRRSDEGGVSSLLLSQPHCAPGDVRDFLPTEFFAAFDEFIARLARICPGLPGGRAALFAPAIEWWMNQIDSGAHMQTAVRGLYSCGDGSGWSQGIVHAAATALWASEGMTGTRLNPAQLTALLRPRDRVTGAASAR